MLIVLLALQGVPIRGAATPVGAIDPGVSGAAQHGVDSASRVVLPAPASGSAPDWQWPLEPAPAVVRRFQPSPTPWGAGHRGVDLAAEVGQPVRAAGPGRVAFSGVIAGQGVVTVQHPDGFRTTYEPVTRQLPRGSVVAAGDPIAVVSATPGHCEPAVCLHWGLIQPATGNGSPTGGDGSGHGLGVSLGPVYLDPLLLLGFDLRPPILLPLGAPPAPS